MSEYTKTLLDALAEVFKDALIADETCDKNRIIREWNAKIKNLYFELKVR